MATNSAEATATATATTTATAPSGYRLISPYEQQPEELQKFWTSQREEVEQITDFKSHKLPHSRIKKIMKLDEDVQMVSAEAPVLLAKACEILIQELTLRSWLHTQEFKRRTLKKSDVTEAIKNTDVYDFLVDVVSKNEVEQEPAGFGGGMVGSSLPPMGPPALSMRQPAPPGVTIGRRAMPWLNVRPPFLPWQSGADDNPYVTGGNGGQGNHGPQS